MEFKIAREELLPVLTKTLGIVEKKSTMPILSNVLIGADESGEITVNATDLEIGISDKCSGEVAKPGSITVRAKSLHDVIKNMPDSPITLSSEKGDWIDITCGRIYFRLVGLPVEDFPSFPELTSVDFIELPVKTTRDMFQKVHFAVSTDESRYSLTGVFVKIDGSDLLMVSTDGHRLCKATKVLEKSTPDSPFNNGIILPKKGVIELMKILESFDEEDAKVAIISNNAFFVLDKMVFVMRIIDGEFPDYRKVLPESYDKKAIIDRDELISSLRRMSVFSYDSAWGIKLSFKENELEIQSNNPDIGEAKEAIVLDSYEGDDFSVGFNVRYLLEAINAMEPGNIELCFNDDLKPGMFHNVGDDDYNCVVMPMRI